MQLFVLFGVDLSVDPTNGLFSGDFGANRETRLLHLIAGSYVALTDHGPGACRVSMDSCLHDCRLASLIELLSIHVRTRHSVLLLFVVILLVILAV